MDEYDKKLCEDCKVRAVYDWRTDWSCLGAQDGVYEYRHKTTKLRVVLVPLPSTKVVSMSICYNVGSKLEKNNVNGSAHILEHLLFKGSKLYNASNHKTIWRLLNGGVLNASTSKDRTEFHCTIAEDEDEPVNKLFTALKVEADRLRQPLIDVDVPKEAIVVRNEYERGKNSEEQKALEVANSVSFEHGSSGSAVIGTNFTIEHIIKPVNMKDLIAFHTKYYCPANATLVICGAGFDCRETLRQIHVAFHGIPPGKNTRDLDEDGQDVSQIEPDTPQRGKKTVNIAGNLPLIVLGFRVNDGMSTEGIALQLLAMWFSSDQAGAFRDILQTKSLGANSIAAEYQRTHGQSLFSVFVYPVSGGDENKRIDDLANRVFQRTQNSGTSDFGMSQQTFNVLRNQLLKQWQQEKNATATYVASIVESVARCDSPFDVSARFNVLQHLTLSDVARTVQEVFVDYRLTEVKVRSSLLKYPMRHPVCTPYKPVFPSSTKFDDLPPNAPVLTVPYKNAVTGDSSVYMKDPNSSTVSLRVHIPTPNAVNTTKAQLCGMLATTGVKINGKVLNEKQLCEQFQNCGAKADVHADYKGINIVLDVPASADFKRLAGMLKAGLTNAAVSRDDFHRKKSFFANELAGDEFSVNNTAKNMLMQCVFHTKGDPRATPTASEASKFARGLNRSDTINTLKLMGSRGGIVTCVAPTNAHLRVARQLFETTVPKKMTLSTPSVSPQAGRILSHPMEGKTSCTMLLGCGVPMNPTHENYIPTLLAVDALGGAFISELMQEVRVKRGLTYGCNSRCAQIDPSTLLFRVSGTFAPSLAKKGVKACRDVVRHWRSKGISQEEFDLAKERALDRHYIGSESSSRVTDALHRARLYFPHPSQHCGEIPDKIKATTFEQCNCAIQSLPAFEDMVTVVAGALPKGQNIFI